MAPELNKIGLYLINVNITDITDESGYIDSIGKKAASEAINRARVDVAEQEKIGAVGQSVAQRDREVQVAQNSAESLKGQKAADAERRVFVQQREAEAVSGENTAQANIARSNADLHVQQAEARQRSEVALREAEVQIQMVEARAEKERLTASEVVRQEIEKRKAEILAAAEAEQTRLRAHGDADAVRARYEAEAEGVRKVLQSKADGYRALVESCGGDPRAAASLLMIEKIEHLVAAQVEAIKNLKIDKITVWDSAGGGQRQWQLGHRQLCEQSDQEPAAAARGREDGRRRAARVPRRDDGGEEAGAAAGPDWSQRRGLREESDRDRGRAPAPNGNREPPYSHFVRLPPPCIAPTKSCSSSRICAADVGRWRPCRLLVRLRTTTHRTPTKSSPSFVTPTSCAAAVRPLARATWTFRSTRPGMASAW